MSKEKVKKTKSKATKGEKVVIAVCVILIIASLITVGVLWLMKQKILLPKDNVPYDPSILTPSDISDKVVNFLLVGISNDENEREKDDLTDTLMVVSLDIEAKKATIIQIPRDTYIGYETSTGKINAIYKQSADSWDYAGLSGLISMINKTLAIPIDHYITIEMDAFAEMIDELGGIEVNVPDDMELNGVSLKAGRQTLSGAEAIVLVRTRNIYRAADLKRMDNQRLVMSALFKKCLNISMVKAASMSDIIYGNVTTDVTVGDALGYYKFVKTLKASDISVATLPGAPTMVSGQSVYGLYPERTAYILNNYFRPYSSDVLAEDLGIVDIVDEPYISEDEDYGVSNISEYDVDKTDDDTTEE